MSNPNSIQTICKHCGQPVILKDLSDVEDGPMKKVLLNLAKTACHTACVEVALEKARAEEEIARRNARLKEWLQICPSLYASTEESKLPFAKQYPEKFQQAMAWKFGPTGLGFFGETGGGKTRAMYLLLRSLYVCGFSVEAMTHPEFSATAVRLAVEGYKGEQSRWVRDLKRADILFIDDLGKSRFTTADGSAKHAEEALWDICENRWQNRKPFFFTCNKRNGDELAASMSEDKGQPFLRRLREFCKIIPT